MPSKRLGWRLWLLLHRLWDLTMYGHSSFILPIPLCGLWGGWIEQMRCG